MSTLKLNLEATIKTHHHFTSLHFTSLGTRLALTHFQLVHLYDMEEMEEKEGKKCAVKYIFSRPNDLKAAEVSRRNGAFVYRSFPLHWTIGCDLCSE